MTPYDTYDGGDAEDARPRAVATPPSAGESATRRLLHRWFVEYNPLYLVSALLVLVGLTLLSRGDDDATTSVRLGAGAVIGEVYAFALIGGAALLTRLGMRRPAVMLAVLCAVYQCDPTLVTERAVYGGAGGVATSVVWIAVFAAKLGALAWALRLRLSRSTIGVAALGAIGVGLMPHALAAASSESSRELLVAVWSTAVTAAALFTPRAAACDLELDAWGEVVFARARRATWALYALAALLHVSFWRYEHELSPFVYLPALLVVAARFVKTEALIVAAFAGALFLVGVGAPARFSSAALAIAFALALRALRKPVLDAPAADASAKAEPPYRATRDAVETRATPPRREVCFALAPAAELRRLLVCAASAAYLACWTTRWSGGAFPAHLLALDGVVTVVAALAVWRLRAHGAIAPLAIVWAQLLVERRVVTAPTTALGFGELAIGVGFALLALSLGVSFALGRKPAVDRP
jgi:hypothetical protein